jgi:putative ABC transport system substrate-binding protein
MGRTAFCNRRHFLRSSLALAGLGLLAGCALQPGPAAAPKVPVVGFLSTNAQAAAASDIAALRQGLGELGYVEGQNIILEYRFADDRDERLPGLAAELVHLQVDVIFAPYAPSALAAKAATDRIPIVSASTDPVGLGLVASLARPGGNVTGLSYASVLIAGKRLELLRNISPGGGRVVALWYTPNPGAAIQLRETQDAAQRLGLELQPVGVQGPDDFEAAFQSAVAERPDALVVIGTPEMNARRERIVEFVASTRLPAMYNGPGWVEGGGLMSYGTNLFEVHRRAATYVDKILKGAKPADLPVEQPTRFDFIINLKTARDIGLTIPQSVLMQATEVIQ